VLKLAGVETASDVPDIFGYLRQSRIAVVPLLRGPAGSPYKVIEAAANRAAVAATPWAVECFGLPGVTATTPTEFAEAIVSLLNDEPRRRRLVESAIPQLERLSVGAIGQRLEDALLTAVDARSAPPVARDRFAQV
jgi:glycosyltransferase involved in cell wall biosynthesis